MVIVSFATMPSVRSAIKRSGMAYRVVSRQRVPDRRKALHSPTLPRPRIARLFFSNLLHRPLRRRQFGIAAKDVLRSVVAVPHSSIDSFDLPPRFLTVVGPDNDRKPIDSQHASFKYGHGFPPLPIGAEERGGRGRIPLDRHGRRTAGLSASLWLVQSARRSQTGTSPASRVDTCTT